MLIKAGENVRLLKPVTVLYLSGLNLMEGKLTIEQQAYGFPPKAKKKPAEDYGEETLTSGS